LNFSIVSKTKAKDFIKVMKSILITFLVLSIQTVFGEICDETLLRKHSNRNAILTAQQYDELYNCAAKIYKKKFWMGDGSNSTFSDGFI
jgi:hypothetical protein